MRMRNAAIFLGGVLLGGLLWAVVQTARERWLPSARAVTRIADGPATEMDTADCANFV